jgi:hypothetical protein
MPTCYLTTINKPQHISVINQRNLLPITDSEFKPLILPFPQPPRGNNQIFISDVVNVNTAGFTIWQQEALPDYGK